MKAVILAGGLGARLAPETDRRPKALVPLGESTILEIILRQLQAFGCKETTLALGHRAEQIEAAVGDGGRLGLCVRHSRESTPLGTAGPLGLIEGLDEPFLVMNCDILTTLDFAELHARHVSSGALGTIAVQSREIAVDFGVVACDARGRLTDYHEKPVHRVEVGMGVYVFDPRVLAYIPRGERLDLPDLVRRLIAAGETVVKHPFEGYWRDIGRPEDYARARLDLDELLPRLFPAR